MATILRDKFMLSAAAAFVLAVLAGWLPMVGAGQRAVWWAFAPAVAAGIPVVVSLMTGSKRALTNREPYFWLYLAIASVCWLISHLAEFWLHYRGGIEAAIPLVLAPRFGFYLAMILAIESLPDRSGQFSQFYANRWIQWSGTSVFFISLLVYFILPGFRGSESGNIMLMAVSLCFGLDIFLILAFSYLGQSTRWFRWQVLYFALAATLLFFALGNGLRLFSGGMAGADSLPAAAWITNGIAMLALALVSRMKTWDAVVSVADETTPRLAIDHASTLHLAWAYAMLLPVLHLFLARAGLLDPDSVPGREVAVLLGMLVLGAIGVIQSRLAERHFRDFRHVDEERQSLKRDRGEMEQLMKERAQRLNLTEQNLRRQIARGQALETDLRKSKERYQVLVESMNEGIGVVDREEKLTYVNQAFGRMLGYSEEEMSGQPLQSFFDEEGRRTYDLQRQRMAKGEEIPFEITWQARDGRTVPTIMSPRVLLGADGQMQGSFSVITDITDIKRAQSEMRNLAHFDGLTNLPNRVLFQDILAREFAQAGRNKNPLALVLVDLDRFRRINDSLGHDIGDALLKVFAQRLEETAGSGTTLARLGADEFALILSGSTSSGEIGRTVERLQQAIGRVFKVDTYEITVTASMGISLYPTDGDSAQILLKNAEAAVEHAKSTGRNNYQFYEAKMNQTALQRLTLENRLRTALVRDELELFYQPKVDISDGRIIGVEALVRWHDPERGMITPSEFIPVAEESGLIGPIGEWVLENACAQAKAWQQDGLPPMSIAVNLSAMQFKSETLPAKVLSALAKSELEPEYLELEITESLAMEDGEKTLVAFGYLKALGVRIAIDDFGTGYSSLAYLRRFPIDTLKIDRDFVVNAAKNKEDQAIVNAIIALGHGMHLNVIAEGVEDKDQLGTLAALGCDQIQGFFVSRPLPAHELTELIRTKSMIPL